MVMKNAKKMKCLPISYNYGKICRSCLEKLPKDLKKIISYLQGFKIIAILENTSKYDLKNCMENTHHGFPLRHIWML